MTLKKLGTRLVQVFLILAFAGCSVMQPVQPWEKGILARPEMTLESDSLEAGYGEHIYFSKEGASGGNGAGGGGCGCN